MSKIFICAKLKYSAPKKKEKEKKDKDKTKDKKKEKKKDKNKIEKSKIKEKKSEKKLKIKECFRIVLMDHLLSIKRSLCSILKTLNSSHWRLKLNKHRLNQNDSIEGQTLKLPFRYSLEASELYSSRINFELL